MSADFLEALWGAELLSRGLFGEIRAIRDGAVVQHYLSGARGAFDQAMDMTQDGWDTYFGVLLRTRREGTADACVTETSVLWADVDAKKASDVPSAGKAIALATINGFPIPPQFLVDSGGGFHCYWKLERPVPHADAKPVMSWIADALNGDKVQDAPRVLRVPGTLNWKRGEPVASRLLRFDLTRLYRFSDFEALLPIRREYRRPNEPRVRIDNLPGWLNELLVQGAPRGQRSETCFRAVIWLLRYGRTPDEIRSLFLVNPEGIGEKYYEKALDGERWLATTLRAAEAVV